MNTEVINIQKVLANNGIKISLDESFKSLVNKIKIRLSEIDNPVLKSKTIYDISQALASRPYLKSKLFN